MRSPYIPRGHMTHILLATTLIALLSTLTISLAVPIAVTSTQVYDDPSMMKPFGTGISQGILLEREETEVFSYSVSSTGKFATMTHFWITGGCTPKNDTNALDDVLVRYYVDNETIASIEYTPSMASGTGFNDEQAPWGTSQFGKGAKSGGWFNYIRVPFQSSIKITLELPYGDALGCGYYIILRGAENLNVKVGDVELPATARLELYKQTNVTYQALDYVTLANVSKSSKGLYYGTTLAVASGNPNFLEGCFRMYGVGSYPDKYPGMLLSTGTEDYFDSAYYFNAGQYHFLNAGYTHLEMSSTSLSWSAYRFHIGDPITFDAGMQLVWRVGDTTDILTGRKCTLEKGGKVVGSPTASVVSSYVWVYTW